MYAHLFWEADAYFMTAYGACFKSSGQTEIYTIGVQNQQVDNIMNFHKAVHFSMYGNSFGLVGDGKKLIAAKLFCLKSSFRGHYGQLMLKIKFHA